MKTSLLKKLTEATGSFELGSILGQRKAFGMVAGRCSAAEAATIQRLRDKRLYAAAQLSWKEFCPTHLGMSRAQADRLIGYLEEFGPEYFELTQLIRIPPETYRAIAPAVKDGHIRWQSEAIALIPENSERVAAAVAGLRGAVAGAEAAPEQTAAAANDWDGKMEALDRRADQVVAEWTRLVAVRCSLPPQQRQSLKNRIARTRQQMERLERQVWNQAR